MGRSPYEPLEFPKNFGEVPAGKAAAILGALDWGARCGIPFHEALETIIRRRLNVGRFDTEIFGRERRWRVAVSLAVESLESGAPLSESLRCLEHFLPEYVFHALVEAERRGADMERTLSALHSCVSRGADVYRRRVNAFIFPFLELFACSGLMVLIIMLVLPRFDRICREFAVESLPWFLSICDRFGSSFIYFFCGLMLLLPSLAVLRFFHIHEPFARALFEALMLRVPFLGRDIRRMAILDAATVMSALLSAGCDVVEAAKVARLSLGSHWLRGRFSVFIERLESGEPWADAWDSMDLGFPFLDWLARNGTAREDPLGCFSSMSAFLSREISSFSIVFAKAVEVLGIFFNASLVVLTAYAVLGFLSRLLGDLAAVAPLGM